MSVLFHWCSTALSLVCRVFSRSEEPCWNSFFYFYFFFKSPILKWNKIPFFQTRQTCFISKMICPHNFLAPSDDLFFCYPTSYCSLSLISTDPSILHLGVFFPTVSQWRLNNSCLLPEMNHVSIAEYTCSSPSNATAFLHAPSYRRSVPVTLCCHYRRNNHVWGSVSNPGRAQHRTHLVLN